jgi:hypothetical protein
VQRRQDGAWQFVRAGAAGWAFLLVGLSLWTLPSSRIPLERVGDTGILPLVPLTCWLGLALVLLGTVTAIWTPSRLREGRAAVHVMVLVVVLYGLVTAGSPYPRGTVSWRHVGVAAHLGSAGVVDPTIDAYFGWPGFFALLASWSGMAGLPDASVLMQWAPVANNLLLLLPLRLLAGALVPDRRRAWSGIVLFYLANWVDQDYLAPQALGFFLYVCLVALLLTLFPATDRLAGRWSPATAPGQVAPQSHEAAGRALIVVVLVIAAVVTTHQLTPFALLLGLAALTGLRSVSVRGLVVLSGALVAVWLAYPASTYLQGNGGDLLAQVGDLAGAAQGGIAERAQGSAGHLLVVRSRIAFSALLWGLAAAGAVRMLRARQLRAAAVGLLVAPALLFPLQSYGGEMLLRIFLFSLPFTALLAAQLLPAGSSARSRRGAGALMLVAAIALSPAFLLVRYGNQLVDQRTTAEVQAVRILYELAPPGSVLVAGNANTPWRNREYADHKHRLLSDLGDPDLPADLADVADLLHAELLSGERPGLVLLTRQQREYERLLGRRVPWTLGGLEQVLLARADFAVVHRDRDAVILLARRPTGPFLPTSAAPGREEPPPFVGPRLPGRPAPARVVAPSPPRAG